LPKKKDTYQLNMTLPLHIAQRLKKNALENGQSLAAQIRFLLTAALGKK